MVSRTGRLLAITALLGGLTGCVWPNELAAGCRSYDPPYPVTLIWTENVDDKLDGIAHFAPPRLEIMPDGRAIADATAVQVLSPTALSALKHRIQADLGTLGRSFTAVSFTRPDGQGWQGREDISLWTGSGSPSDSTIIFQPAPLDSAPSTGARPTVTALTLDTGLPPAWKDAVDTLNALTLQTLAEGKPYQSDQISVLVSYDDNIFSLISDGKLVKGTGAHSWPAGFPHVPAYQPGGPSTYPIQQFGVSGSGAVAARHAFVQYLHWPATLQLYDDGIAGQHYGWYGVWRSRTPSEQETGAMPIKCLK